MNTVKSVRRLLGIVIAAILVVPVFAFSPPVSAHALADMDPIAGGSPPVTISTPGEQASGAKVVSGNGVLAAFWSNDKNGTITLAASVSADRGGTWSTPTHLSTGGSGADLVVADGDVFVTMWTARVEGVHLLHTVTLSSSGTWGEVRTIPTPDINTAKLISHPNGITALWVESLTTVVSRSSTDHGVTWSDPVTLGSGPRNWTSALALIEREGELTAIWKEDFPESSADTDSFMLSRSTDGGATWTEKEVLAPALEASINFEAVQTATSIVLSWTGIRHGTDERLTQLAVSLNAGRDWQVRDWIPPAEAEFRFMVGNDDVVIVGESNSSFRKSLDGGLTWGAPQYPYGSASWSPLGQAALVGDSFYLTDFSPGPIVSMGVSRDLGSTWSWGSVAISPFQTGRLPMLAAVDDAVISYWIHGTPGSSVLQASSVLETEPLGGRDRYETAIRVSQQFDGFAGQPGSVAYIATGANFPDALVASAAAASRGGPLLLTRRDGLDSAAIAELRRLGPAKIIIVGGTNVVSDRVRSQAAAVVGATNVVRIGGADRYDTARRVVAEAFPRLDTLYVATGRDFPDALGASAAAVSLGAAVMVTDGSSNEVGADLERLMRSTSVDRVVIAGGTSVVSRAIESQLRGLLGSTNVTRVGGADRYETSALLNASGGPYGSTVYFATGSNFADALGGGALAGATGSRLFTVPQQCVPGSVLAQLGGVRFVRLLGGPATLGGGVRQLVKCR